MLVSCLHLTQNTHLSLTIDQEKGNISNIHLILQLSLRTSTYCIMSSLIVRLSASIIVMAKHLPLVLFKAVQFSIQRTEGAPGTGHRGGATEEGPRECFRSGQDWGGTLFIVALDFKRQPWPLLPVQGEQHLHICLLKNVNCTFRNTHTFSR